HLGVAPSVRTGQLQSAELGDQQRLALIRIARVVGRMAVGTFAESPIETPVATREVGRSRVVVQVAEIRDGVLPSVVGNHGPPGVELVGQVVQPDEKARPDRGFYVFETK